MAVMDFLQENGIALRDTRPGNYKTTCPQCSHTRKNRRDPCLSVTIDGDGAVWNCHHCGYSGGSKEGQQAPRYERREYTKPKREANPERTDKLLEWFKARAISPATVEHFGIYRTRQWFPQTGNEQDCIAFPYEFREQLRNVKYRTADKHFRQEKNPEPVLFNADSIDEGQDLIWCEGEMDVMAFYEAGFPHVVSLPNGAPAKPEESDKRYEPLGLHWDDLKNVRRHYIATDMDEPGERLASELARRLGKDKCFRVRFTQGKDGNECLIAKGADVLRADVDFAEPWPIDGLYEASAYEGDVLDLYHGRGPKAQTTGFREFDNAFRFLPGQFVVVTGIPNHGKALDINTPIPTPTGWKSMADLKAGDQVFDETGKPCNVVGATEVMVDRPCVEVVFSDGTTVVTDEQHQWLTISEKARRSARAKAKRGARPLKTRGTDQTHKMTGPSVVTSLDISKQVKAYGKYNHQVQCALPVEYQSRELVIPPYTLGAWLGDGSSAGGDITCFDGEILDRIRDDGFTITEWSKPGRYGILGLRVKLRGLSLLHRKHIPDEYLQASVSQRLELLKGLMDTDGTAGGSRGRVCEFTSVNKDLSNGVFELAASLGLKPRMVVGKATLNGKDCGQKYRVLITTDKPIFSLKRKIAKQQIGKTQRNPNRTIVAVNEVPSRPVKCIQVDSQNSLYLCTHAFIPTHNSRFLDQIACQTADLHGDRWAVFSPETGEAQHIADLCEIRAGGHFFDGPSPRISEAELRSAMDWVKRRFVFIGSSEHTPTVDWVLERARAAVVRHGVNHLIIDPYNELEAGRPSKQTETEFVSQLISKLKRFARHHEVTVWLVAHPTKMQRDDTGQYRIPGLYDISGSAHFNNKADAGLVVYRDYDEKATFVFSKKIRRQPICGSPGVAKFLFVNNERRFSEIPNSYEPLTNK